MTMQLSGTPIVLDPLPAYDWQEPARPQNRAYDCSQDSLEWCLYAWGRTPDDAWMEASMEAAGVMNPAVGCTDASGAGLARWLNQEYAEFGYAANNQTNVTFDQVAEEAGRHAHALAMGGVAWCHWTGVRGHDAINDKLLLANPANGYQNVYQTLSRQQFADLGPFHLVRLTHPAAEEGGGGSPSTTFPIGPDVSSHQGAVDWAAVKAAGCSFAFSKASGGAWYRNPYFAAAWEGMKQAGLQRGAYHFAFETSGQPLPGPGPEAEADYFLQTVLPHGLARGDMLVLDIEQGAGQLGHWALRWCRYVQQAVGFTPLIYTGKWFSDPHGFAQVPELAQYPLWLADYSATSVPAPAAPWTKTSFWQCTDHASVPGVSTPADGNLFNGPLASLPSYGKPGDLPISDPYAPWAGLVGSGLLDAMKVDKVLPAQSRSTWLPLGQSPADIEECIAEDGCVYRWLLVNSTLQKYTPY